ncbi:MAG: hypothetical protein H6867_05250 [Rhodospirillales bacterium]|nr:hypothetical protein [Rhodospirillales bacterium]MCB9994935.1 hypothetical protein [Rhodospirillales bacterium]
MKNSDKYLLLTSLSFFYGCMAIALMNLNTPGVPPASYMYTPQIESAQKQPIAEAIHRPRVIPQSVMSYSAGDLKPESQVTCYLPNDYDTLIHRRANSEKARLAFHAEIDGDKLEIYTTPDNKYFVFVSGPDNTGQMESCEVAAGTGWQAVTAP